LRPVARAPAADAYRSNGTSNVIRSDLDALAYAAVRKPAIYAAIRASLLTTPHVAKGQISLGLCAPAKIEERVILRRDKAAYKAAKNYA
jgi:ribosomal protein RSM22 (predicted rRNA methylase)